MSVLLVVIDMENVISFIKSEISSGEGGGYRGPGHGSWLGCSQTETAGYTYNAHHTHCKSYESHVKIFDNHSVLG